MALRAPDCRPGTFHVDGTLVMGSLKGNLGRSGLLGWLGFTAVGRKALRLAGLGREIINPAVQSGEKAAL